jgi:hypothetical protein
VTEIRPNINNKVVMQNISKHCNNGTQYKEMDPSYKKSMLMGLIMRGQEGMKPV